MITHAHPLSRDPAASAFVPGRSLLLQRKCACGSSASPLTGECADCNAKKRLQTRLAVGASNDPLESEADRVADQVLAGPARPALGSAALRIQRYTAHAATESDAAPASVGRALARPGQPLDTGLRRDMERRFAHDFSRVRVHSDGLAEQSARDVNAHAYTIGHDIVFAGGRFAPGTHEGRRLLAHELTHVVQQGGSTAPMIQRQPATGGNAVAHDGPVSVDEQKDGEASPCPSWFNDAESLAKRAAEQYARNDLSPPSQATVQRIECEKPASNGNYACNVHFSDGLVIRVIVRRRDVVVGVPPFNTMNPPAARPLCFYDYTCPDGQLVLSKRECRSSK